MDNKHNLSEHDCCDTGECGCGEEHDHEHEEMVIDIEMEDGSKIECDVLGNFEVEDKEYMVLLPRDEEAVLLFKYEEDEENEEFELNPIEDEEEFKTASEAYYQLFSEEEIDE